MRTVYNIEPREGAEAIRSYCNWLSSSDIFDTLSKGSGERGIRYTSTGSRSVVKSGVDVD